MGLNDRGGIARKGSRVKPRYLGASHLLFLFFFVISVELRQQALALYLGVIARPYYSTGFLFLLKALRLVSYAVYKNSNIPVYHIFFADGFLLC